MGKISQTFTLTVIIILVIVLIYIIADYLREKRRRRGERLSNREEKYCNEKKRVEATNDLIPNIKPHFKVATDKYNRMITHLSKPIGYTPDQIRKAYGLDKISEKGKGQTIAIIDAYSNPNAIEDFKTFDSTFNLGNPGVLTVYSLGKQPSESWGLEANLDIQWAHAIAPEASIILIQAVSESLGDLSDAITYALMKGATIISMSWGSTEFSQQNFYEKNFSHAIFVASSGDEGGIVNWPSSSLNVISVGGTSLNLDSNGNYGSEIGWSGSGGGSSVINKIPQWQASYGLKGMRQTPDISCVADPTTGVAVYDSYGYQGQLGWFRIGGTSLSSPIVAGIFAIANESRVNIGKTILSNVDLQNYIYNTLANTQNYSSSFNDVTKGKAGNNSAQVGYDNVTGLGSFLNISETSGFISNLVNLIP